MIFLIFNIFIYLLLASLIGAAAGWLLRNLQAQRREEEATLAVADARSKLPQMETLLRGRDKQMTKLKSQFAEVSSELKALAQAPNTLEEENQQLQRELTRYKRDARRATRALEAEQQKVRQMASERELQHRSLHVLNQQLELERNRRAAAG